MDDINTTEEDLQPEKTAIRINSEQRKISNESKMDLTCDQKPFRCTDCSRSFKSSNELKRHLLIHTGEKPFVCEHCGRGFTQEFHLRRHVTTHFTDKPFHCSTCGKGFGTKPDLRRHNLVHGERRFHCPESGCGRAFIRAEHLRAHAKVHSGQKTHLCQECGQAFMQLSGLRRHLWKHTGIKCHPCPICNKSFTQPTYLKKHIMTHTGSKPYQCEECEADFLLLSELKAHREIHIQDKKFPCTTCGIRFNDDEALLNHSLEHYTSKEFVCKVCGERFQEELLLKMHSSIHTICSNCGKYFKYPSRLQRHLKLAICQKPLKQSNDFTTDMISDTSAQNVCDTESNEGNSNPEKQTAENESFSAKLQAFTAISEGSQQLLMLEDIPVIKEEPLADLGDKQLDVPMNQSMEIKVLKEAQIGTESGPVDGFFHVHRTSSPDHAKNPARARPFKCSDCSKSFHSAKSLRIHIRSHTGEKPFVCGVCGRGFSQQTHLKRHAAIHSTEKSFKCLQCDKGFGTQADVNRHRKSVHEERQFLCPEPDCGRAFSRAEHLRDHALMHSGVCAHLCSECGKRFKRPSSLKRHLQLHTGAKPYECEYCSKTFSTSDYLKVHLLTHTGVKEHKCPHCDKEFTQRGGLKAHLVTHTGEKPFECNICGKRYTERGSMTKHRSTHFSVSGKDFVCNICGKSFSRVRGLRDHSFTHLGGKPLKCTECDRDFVLPGQLKKHMAKVHDKEPSGIRPLTNSTDFPPKTSHKLTQQGRLTEITSISMYNESQVDIPLGLSQLPNCRDCGKFVTDQSLQKYIQQNEDASPCESANGSIAGAIDFALSEIQNLMLEVEYKKHNFADCEQCFQGFISETLLMGHLRYTCHCTTFSKWGS